MNKLLFQIASGLICCFLLIPNVSGFDHSHASFNAVLQENVVLHGAQSTVRYGVIKQNPGMLNRYIQEIETVAEGEFLNWTKNQQVAFLINAYNALTIKLILTKYPDLESIKDLGGFFSGPWKIEFFTLFGKPRHLDHIEHEILRKKYTEPRIHFALVCASIGCPPLRTEAYLPEKLNEQLNRAMVSFLRDPERNRFDKSKKRLYLSSIFKWFSGDFEKVKPSVEAFVAPWIAIDIESRELISRKRVKVTYLDYDWSLNRAN